MFHPPFPLRALLPALLILFAPALAGCRPAPDPASDPMSDHPNVILIVTDDQGYGDFGVTGNPVIRTPHLDAMAARSAQMTTFYVSPVCAPTRASLMTGRYNYRTRAIDTWNGRAMMEPDEVTLAEVLGEAGYRTGLFGKWHLGDTYPMRPMDQGFQEVLMHLGGGIGQASDPPGGEGKYTDAVLFHNGERVQTEGYCTDVYFDRALDWIEAGRAGGEPFFAYIATNAPHSPFDDVPPDLLAEYRQMDLGNDRFPQAEGHPLPDDADTDRRARIFAMITNIDANVGRLFDRLDRLGLTDETLVVFMVDNGPNANRYVAGMRGWKGSVYEGGIRSPLFLHWPARLPAGAASDWPAAHIDVMPTLLDALRLDPPAGVALDGSSFLPALTGEAFDAPDRFLAIQAHRGNPPVRYHHFMIRDARWKLVHESGFHRTTFEGAPAFELYDLAADPLETVDLAADRPDEVARLRAAYDAWFDDVGRTRPDNYTPPPIYVGTPHESPTLLTRQDWHPDDESTSWTPAGTGAWNLYVATADSYEVHVRFPEALASAGTATLILDEAAVHAADVAAGQANHTFRAIPLQEGPLHFRVVLETEGAPRAAWQVEMRRRSGG